MQTHLNRRHVLGKKLSILTSPEIGVLHRIPKKPEEFSPGTAMVNSPFSSESYLQYSYFEVLSVSSLEPLKFLGALRFKG